RFSIVGTRVPAWLVARLPYASFHSRVIPSGAPMATWWRRAVENRRQRRGEGGRRKPRGRPPATSKAILDSTPPSARRGCAREPHSGAGIQEMTRSYIAAIGRVQRI